MPSKSMRGGSEMKDKDQKYEDGCNCVNCRLARMEEKIDQITSKVEKALSAIEKVR